MEFEPLGLKKGWKPELQKLLELFQADFFLLPGAGSIPGGVALILDGELGIFNPRGLSVDLDSVEEVIVLLDPVSVRSFLFLLAHNLKFIDSIPNLDLCGFYKSIKLFDEIRGQEETVDPVGTGEEHRVPPRTDVGALGPVLGQHLHLRLQQPGSLITQSTVKTIEVSNTPCRCAKFIVRKQWVVAGSDDLQIRVFNYNTNEKVSLLNPLILRSGPSRRTRTT